MYDHVLRQPKRIVFQPLARRLRISPNLLTAIGLLPGLASALACVFGFFQAALWLWLINRVMDGLDGEVARAHNKQSDLGGYLDILADLLVYASIPLALALYWNSMWVWGACSFMLMSFYLNVGSWMYLSSILEKLGLGAEETGESTSVCMPRGLVEGAETILFFTLFLAFPKFAALLFVIFGLLTFVGAAIRVRWACHVLPRLRRLDA
jgi:phosphatidylglycerophosphate synthase